MNANAKVSATILRKVTIKNCGWSSDDILKAITRVLPDGKTVEFDGKVDLLRIWGRATDAKPGQSDNGSFVKLVGEFHALNVSTGERFRSGHMILPNFIGEPMGGALRESPSVEFALSIGAQGDETSVTRYVFTVSEAIEAAPSAAMQRLEQAALGHQMPALAAPAPAADPAPAPAPAAVPVPAPAPKSRAR